MNETYESGQQLSALAIRIAALEDNVAFLEQWCEEQQDALDRVARHRAASAVGCDYEIETEPEITPRALLRVVDLRDSVPASESEVIDGKAIVAVVETEHDRRVRQIRAQLSRLRTRLVSARPAGRTAP